MKFLNRSSVRFLIVLALLLTVFVSRRFSEVTSPQWEQPTMGTLCHITLSDSIAKNRLKALRAEIDACLVAVNDRMSTWQFDSEISTFNALQDLEPFPVSPEFAGVVRRALEMAESTEGAFDPTVKPLVDFWGFGAKAGSAEGLEEILPGVGWQKVRLEDGALSKMHPDVQLDLSAIAKGYGVDAVADVIRAAGLTNFIVEIGGEIVASGINPNGSIWRVGVEAPQAGEAFGAQIFQTLELSDGAMATSGDYRNFRTREDGSRFSHIIDPVSGMPAETDVAAVSVLAASCMDADAAATSLFVMGSERGFQWLETHPEFEALFILHSTNQTFVSRSTDGFPADQ